MQIVKCPRTGHVRKFANGRAAKRWLREQAEKYVPTVEEDAMAFAGISKVDVDYVLVAPGKLIAKKTGIVHHERTIGGDWSGGDKLSVAGKSVKGEFVRKQAGVVNRFDATKSAPDQFKRKVLKRGPSMPEELREPELRKNIADQIPRR